MSGPADFRDMFLQEAEELLNTIEETILDLEDDPSDKQAIDGLFRAMHTLKGSGAMFGFDDIAEFAHHVESTLEIVRDGTIKATRDLIDLVLRSQDHIRQMLEETRGGPPTTKSDRRAIVEALEKLIPRRGRKQAEPLQNSIVPPPSPKEKERVFRIRFQPSPEIFLSGMDPSLLFDELRDLGSCAVSVSVKNLPELSEMDPEQCYLKWDIVLTARCSIDTVKDVFIFVDDAPVLLIEDITPEDEEVPKLGEILISRGDTTAGDIQTALSKQEKLGSLLEKEGTSPEVVESALAEQRALSQRRSNAAQETLRVPSIKLDRLINLVGELVINQAQLGRVAHGIDSAMLSNTVEEVDRLTTELRDLALNIRMMPIGSTFSRFRRVVRDLSKELGKQVELITEGAETEMDKTVIDRLGDPLVHLIRNSIDHGIEAPDKRERDGKPLGGTIRLSATHRGARVVIAIEDDGKGLDSEAIRAKGVERGLIGADAQLSEQDIFALILQPGFSTAEAITSVSGRGVGMDVVRREIEALRGVINIRSTPGEGTRIELSLPLTLAIIDGLLVAIGDDKFVIPVNIIEECVDLRDIETELDPARNVIEIRGELIPTVRLREVFESEPPEAGRDVSDQVVVVDLGDIRVGLVVDEVLGDHQTVIKSLGRIYREVEGVSGATILGDGTVALIVDVASVVKVARLLEHRSVNSRVKQFRKGA